MNNNKLGGAKLSQILMIAAAVLISTNTAYAGKTFDLGNDKSFSIGAGIRSSFSFVEDGAGNGDDWSQDFDLESVRLYTSGQVNKILKFTFNTEIDDNSADGTGLQVLDGIVQMDFQDAINLWMGRFLRPTDRSNLSGPYYLNMWAYPAVSKAPQTSYGRDEGVAVWGQFAQSKFKYQVGFFRGQDSVPGGQGANPKDSPLFSARAVVNVWDGEEGYYNSSTYYGEKDILAFGLSIESQSDQVGTAATTLGDYFYAAFDFLFEKKLNNAGVLDVEAALYSYDFDNVQDDQLGFMVVTSYLLPGNPGDFGLLHPKIRLQILDDDDKADVTDEGFTQLDLQLDYVMEKHDARTSIVLGHKNPKEGDSSLYALFGVQLQL